jgi:hypothetical protein
MDELNYLIFFIIFFFPTISIVFIFLSILTAIINIYIYFYEYIYIYIYMYITTDSGLEVGYFHDSLHAQITVIYYCLLLITYYYYYCLLLITYYY